MKCFLIAAVCFISAFVFDGTSLGKPLQGHQRLIYGDANAVGVHEESLIDAVSIIRDAVDEDEIPGAVILVARRGKILLHEALGYSDIKRQKPLKTDTLFRMASNSKALTAAGILILVDDGVVDLDAPVGTYLPAFANEQWQAVNVRHLLTHTSGSLERLRCSMTFINYP